MNLSNIYDTSWIMLKIMSRKKVTLLSLSENNLSSVNVHVLKHWNTKTTKTVKNTFSLKGDKRTTVSFPLYFRLFVYRGILYEWSVAYHSIPAYSRLLWRYTVDTFPLKLGVVAVQWRTQIIIPSLIFVLWT